MGRPKKNAETANEPNQEEALKQETIQPVKPVIRVIQPERAMPSLVSHNPQQSTGTVFLWDKRLGKGMHINEAMAQNLMKHNKDYEIRRK